MLFVTLLQKPKNIINNLLTVCNVLDKVYKYVVDVLLVLNVGISHLDIDLDLFKNISINIKIILLLK